MSINNKDYPKNWKKIALKIKKRNKWKCERCGHKHDVKNGYCLTVHHLDGNKTNCENWNLACLCQRCHLSIQSRVKMDQMFMESIIKMSKWFKPHYWGYIKHLKKKLRSRSMKYRKH